MADVLQFAGKDQFGVCDPQKLDARLRELLSHIKSRGILMQEGRECLTGYSYGELYDWDLYFETLFLSWFGEARYCRNGVEAFLDRQLDCGFVARTMGNCFQKDRHHFKPFLAQIALLGCRQTKDYRWLRGKYYTRLQKYLEYWFRHCDSDKNGLCFWDGSDHSGMDNQALRLGYDGVMEFEGADLNTYLVRELEAMAHLAGELGYTEDSWCYREKAKDLTAKIEEYLWDEEDGFYYDRSEKTGKLNKIRSIGGLIPLWLDGLNPQRVERLVREHLTNPEEFWLEYPLATWAKNEKGYYQERKGGECTWMGAAWIPTNYMVFEGLRKYGYHKEAKALAEKTYELVISEACTREYYNAETGAGQGLCPFWGWSSLGYLFLAELALDYDPTNLDLREFITLEGLTY